MAPIKSVTEYFEKVVVPAMRTLFLAMFGPKQEGAPELPEGPPTPHPYRGSQPPPAPEAKASDREIVVTCETRGDDGRDKAQIQTIITKTRRRAIRYFRGLERPGTEREVKHRVTDRKPESIEFGYFRRSGKPLHIRWRKEPYPQIQDQK